MKFYTMNREFALLSEFTKFNNHLLSILLYANSHGGPKGEGGMLSAFYAF